MRLIDIAWVAGLIEGEKHHSSKLTDAQHEEMLGLWATGNYTKSALAKKYGVTLSAISRRIRK